MYLVIKDKDNVLLAIKTVTTTWEVQSNANNNMELTNAEPISIPIEHGGIPKSIELADMGEEYTMLSSSLQLTYQTQMSVGDTLHFEVGALVVTMP